MKNATKHQKKLKKFLAGMDKSRKAPAASAQPIDVMIHAVLEQDANVKMAEKARAAVDHEFVDTNELRVAPLKEIAEVLGKDYPAAKEKGAELINVLNALFARYSVLTLEHAAKMSKRDLRRHLAELGLGTYAAAYLMLAVYDGHAVPVDQSLVDCLEMDGLIEPGSTAEEVQSLLERSVLQKHAWAAHLFLREHVAKSYRVLARKRKADSAATQAAEAAAEAAEQAEAKAEALAAAKPSGSKPAARPAKASARSRSKSTPKSKASTPKPKAPARRKPAGRPARKRRK